MSLAASCVRCSAPVVPCPDHGGRHPLWRSDDEATYEAFAEHLAASPHFPDLPAVADEPGLVGDGLRAGR